MTRQNDNVLQRQVLAVARKYRRDGYRVSLSERGDPLPSFLDGCLPDLVAERDDDHVVVMVKRADAVRGSNDLVALAKVIDRQPKWRFEFISVPADQSIVFPDVAGTSREVRQLADMGFSKAAYSLGWAIIESLVTATALMNDINPASHAFPELVRKFVVLGVISTELREMLLQAGSIRNGLVHHEGLSPSHTEVDWICTLATRFVDEAAEVEAA